MSADDAAFDGPVGDQPIEVENQTETIFNELVKRQKIKGKKAFEELHESLNRGDQILIYRSAMLQIIDNMVELRHDKSRAMQRNKESLALALIWFVLFWLALIFV